MTQTEQPAPTPTVFVPAMRPSPLAELASQPGADAVPEPGAAEPAAGLPRSGTAFAVVAALVCGVLGFLGTPVLLGPAAVVGAFAGERLGRSGTRNAAPAAVLVLTVAALVAALVLL